MRCAVLVNDMGEINVDANIVRDAKLVQVKEDLVQLENGCICCTLRADLVEEIARLVREDRFDYLVIESTGISEPMQVAETFTMPIPMQKVLDLAQTKSESNETSDMPSEDYNNPKMYQLAKDFAADPDGCADEVVVGLKMAIYSALGGSLEAASWEEVRVGCEKIETPTGSAIQIDVVDINGMVYENAKIEANGKIEVPGLVAIPATDEDSAALAPLSSLARLDTCVTVIDGANFGLIMDSVITIQEGEYSRMQQQAVSREYEVGVDTPKLAPLADEDQGTLVDLMVDQIEFADVIIINKLDLALPDQINRVKAIVAQLNPSAKLANVNKIRCAAQ